LKKEIKKSLKEILMKEGMRYTKQRLAILQQIESSSGHHDAESIYTNIRAKNLNVSRATVYRTLDMLDKNRLIRKLDVGDGRIRYESRKENDHHDHMICLETGDIIEFFDEELERIQDKIAKKHGYKVIRHSHQLFVKPIK
tara:strand:- start:2982 stop:3404 length:423 start_codon:yes stop_codon:yes gene_type:complete